MGCPFLSPFYRWASQAQATLRDYSKVTQRLIFEFAAPTQVSLLLFVFVFSLFYFLLYIRYRKYLLKEWSILGDLFKSVHIERDVSKHRIPHKCIKARPGVRGNQPKITPFLHPTSDLQIRQPCTLFRIHPLQVLGKEKSWKIIYSFLVLVWEIWKLYFGA